MPSNLLDALRPYLNALLIGVGGILVAFIVSRLIRLLLVLPLGKTASRFIGSLFSLGVLAWTVKLILDNTGAAGLLAVIVTAITAAFSLGSERVFGDLLAGVSIFLGRTYKEGDYLVIAGQEGWVSNVSLFVTTLENVNGDEIYVRNAEATNGTIVNYSARPGQLISVKVLLPVNQDRNVTVKVIEDAIQNFSSELSKEPRYQPTVVVETTTGAYFTVEVRAYAAERLNSGPEKTRLLLLATNAIKAAGLSLVP